MTRVIIVDPDTPFDELTLKLKEVAEAVCEGALVAFPTETVYGLGCNPFNRDAVERLYEIKGRPRGRPLPLLISSLHQAEELASEISDAAMALMRNFFPGPLTLVLKRSERVPDEVCGYTDKVGIRYPKHNIPIALIVACGVPLATPSANLSGHISPTDAGEVMRQLGGQIDFVIDGGETKLGVESTVVDMTISPPRILRLGAIVPEEIEAAIGMAVEVDEAAMVGRYRPLHARLLLIDIEDHERRINTLMETATACLEEGCKVAVLATEETVRLLSPSLLESPKLRLVNIGSESELDRIATSLYKHIAAADRDGFEVILVEAVPGKGIGRAIMQRLSSAAHKVIR